MDSDQPITGQEQDRFGRAPLVDSIAADLSTGAGADGVVAALVGPWGSGKTSVLNLVKARLAASQETVVIEFNPWFFSGTEQLVEHFLAELTAQLGSRTDRTLQALASRLDAYRQVLEPVGAVPVIGWFAKLGAAVGSAGSVVAKKSARFGATSVQGKRRAIEDALKASDHRFVIIVDDIDRLQPQEVRDIVRLVRLVADFPRVSYLLAFDRQRVERVLGDGDENLGRDYLEKIVQLLYMLPVPSRSDLARFTFESVDQSINGLQTRDLDERYWGNVSAFVVQPLLRTPRDAKRYANALPSTIRAIGNEVNLADVLALEAVRVLLPNVFDELPRLSEALTYVGSGYVGGSDRLGGKRDAFRVALTSLIDRAGDRGDAVQELLRWVFPGSQAFTGNNHYGPDWAQTWRRERRVASAEVFAIYLAGSVPEGALPTALIDLVSSSLSDGDILDAAFQALPDDLLEPTMARLEDFEDEFPDEPLGAIVTIENLRPRLRSGRRGMFDMGADMRVDRLVLRLLRKVEPEPRRDEVAMDAYERITTLSARLSLLRVVGHRENVGHGLVSEEAERGVESRLRADIRSASPGQLAQERELNRLVAFLRESGDVGDLARLSSVLTDDAVLVGLLRSSLSETMSQSFDEVTVQREAVLPWSWLESLLLPEDLADRVLHLEVPEAFAGDTRAVDAVATAHRYADGWRPESDERIGRATSDDGEDRPTAHADDAGAGDAASPMAD